MNISGAIKTSVEGMNRQVGTLNRAAYNIANATTVDDSNVDIGNEMVDMVVAEHFFKANFRAFQIADDVMATMVNLKR